MVVFLLSERRYCQKLAHSPEPTQSEPSCPNARAETGAGINNVAAGAEGITDGFKKTVPPAESRIENR